MRERRRPQPGPWVLGQLALQLLLLASSSRSQPHPPGTGWPAEGAGAPSIVAAVVGAPLGGAIDSPGGSMWYSFDAVANRKLLLLAFAYLRAAAALTDNPRLDVAAQMCT